MVDDPARLTDTTAVERLHRSGMDTVNDAIQLIIVVTAVAVIVATMSGMILN